MNRIIESVLEQFVLNVVLLPKLMSEKNLYAASGEV